MTALPELRLADLVTLLAVQRAASISGAARELRVTPSQVSKAISRLERHFGARLLSRGARGVAPTPAGQRVLPRLASIVEDLRAATAVRDDQHVAIEITIAGPSYLVGRLLPGLTELLPRSRVRGLELAPACMRAYVVENVFDVAVAPGGIESRPAAWTTDEVGSMRSALFARPMFARRVGSTPLTPDRVRTLPFVGPTSLGTDRFVALGDDCPLPAAERWVAHEVQTIGTALELAARSDHLVFGPVLAARRLLDAGALVELPVVGWDVREQVHIVSNGDRVLARARTAVVRAARDMLAADAA
jgi:DNA-binding transcriptional LysR family regulator